MTTTRQRVAALVMAAMVAAAGAFAASATFSVSDAHGLGNGGTVTSDD
jgi:hypothetical protein